MENRIPLPTDNIFKFYAIFGLLLFIFSLGAMITTNELTNDRMVKTYLELETIKILPALTSVDEVRKEVLQQRLMIIQSDKKLYKYSLAFITSIAFYMMGYGFYKWHMDIQPLQDEIAKLQLEKLRSEVTKIKVYESAE